MTKTITNPKTGKTIESRYINDEDAAQVLMAKSNLNDFGRSLISAVHKIGVLTCTPEGKMYRGKPLSDCQRFWLHKLAMTTR